MKHKREHLLRQIGIGIEEAKFNRLYQRAARVIPESVRIYTLGSRIVVHPSHLEYARKEIANKICEELHKSGCIHFIETDAWQHGMIEVTGTVRFVKDATLWQSG